MIDVEQVKREWREKAIALGIDMQEGATSYQVANLVAERAKVGHARRMAALVLAQARANPQRWLRRNGEVDWQKVAVRGSRYWWVVGDYWNQRDESEESAVMRPTEVFAIYRLYRRAARQAIRYARLLTVDC